jgi:hypothetical protein
MDKIRWLHPLTQTVILVSILCGAVSCAGAPDARPRVWIDFPSDGMVFTPGTTITVVSHAYAREGIAEVVFSVNGEAYRRDAPSSPGADFSQFNQDWQPAGPGIFAIQVVAYDTLGQPGNPAVITIRVTAGCPTPIGGGPTPVSCEPVVNACPSPVGGGPTPVSCEPVVNACPSPVGGGPTPVSCPPTVITVTPVITDTPTFTPPPPAQTLVQFWADPAQMAAGACTTMRWHVENAQRVIFGGIDQPFDGSYEDCLCEDERYTLTVIRQDGIEEKHRVDIDVIGSCVTPTIPPPAEDTTPPSAPPLSSPANGAKLNCTTTQTLEWRPVKDESGISTYYVKLEKQVRKQWQSAGGTTSTGTNAVIQPECNYTYRWMVRAQDGAGNYSDWSAYSTFSIYPPVQ